MIISRDDRAGGWASSNDKVTTTSSSGSKGGWEPREPVKEEKTGWGATNQASSSWGSYEASNQITWNEDSSTEKKPIVSKNPPTATWERREEESSWGKKEERRNGNGNGNNYNRSPNNRGNFDDSNRSSQANQAINASTTEGHSRRESPIAASSSESAPAPAVHPGRAKLLENWEAISDNRIKKEKKGKNLDLSSTFKCSFVYDVVI